MEHSSAPHGAIRLSLCDFRFVSFVSVTRRPDIVIAKNWRGGRGQRIGRGQVRLFQDPVAAAEENQRRSRRSSVVESQRRRSLDRCSQGAGAKRIPARPRCLPVGVRLPTGKETKRSGI